MWTILLLLIACFAAVNPDHYRDETQYLYAAFAIFIAIYIKKRTHLLPALLFAWCVPRGTFLFSAPIRSSLDAEHICLKAATDSHNAQASFAIVLVSWVALVIPVGNLLPIFPLLAVCNSIYMLFNHGSAVMDDPAMDASFVAALLPLLFILPKNKWRHGAILLTVTAILASGSVTGFLALIVATGFILRPNYKRCIAFALAILTTFLMVPFNHSFTNLNGRERIWKLAWNYFQDNGKPWFLGFGTGSFALLGTGLTEGPERYIWLHNDWYQLFWEQGLPALLVALTLAVCVLKRLWRRTSYFAAAATYSFIMLSQFPLRHTISALYGACLIRVAFLENESQLE